MSLVHWQDGFPSTALENSTGELKYWLDGLPWVNQESQDAAAPSAISGTITCTSSSSATLLGIGILTATSTCTSTSTAQLIDQNAVVIFYSPFPCSRFGL